MDYSPLIAFLRQKQYLTDLEKDILDTENELQFQRMNRNSTLIKAASSHIKVSTARPAPAAFTSSMTTSGKENTHQEMPTASAFPAMSMPKPEKNAKKNWR